MFAGLGTGRYCNGSGHRGVVDNGIPVKGAIADDIVIAGLVIVERGRVDDGAAVGDRGRRIGGIVDDRRVDHVEDAAAVGVERAPVGVGVRTRMPTCEAIGRADGDGARDDRDRAVAE